MSQEPDRAPNFPPKRVLSISRSPRPDAPCHSEDRQHTPAYTPSGKNLGPCLLFVLMVLRDPATRRGRALLAALPEPLNGPSRPFGQQSAQAHTSRRRGQGRDPAGRALLACHMRRGDKLPKPRRRVLALPRLRQDFGGQAGDDPSRKEKQDTRTHSKEPRAEVTDLERQRYRLRLPRHKGASRSARSRPILAGKFVEGSWLMGRGWSRVFCA